MKRLAFYFIGITASLALGLALFLCYLRFSYLIVPFKQMAQYEIKLKISQQEGYYKFQPGIYINGPTSTTYSINKDGFRGQTEKVDLRNKYSIVALGESSTMGIEVNDDQTWPELLNKLLRAQGFDSRALNAGVGGINSTQMLNLYKHEIAELNPTIVIYYGGRNDHGLGAGQSRYPGPDLWQQGFWNWLKNYIVFQKTTLRLVQYRIFGRQYIDLLPTINQWLPIYEKNLTRLIASAKSRNICFVIAQQIMPFDATIVEHLKKNDFEMARRHFYTSHVAWPELFRQIDLYEAQAAIAARDGVPVVSFLNAPDFLNSGLFIKGDTVHLSEMGNLFIANQLANRIPNSCPTK
jgi:hypothetical protein